MTETIPKKKKKRKSPLKNIFLISFSLISLGNVFSVFLEMEKVSPEYFFLFVLENKKKNNPKKNLSGNMFFSFLQTWQRNSPDTEKNVNPEIIL